MPVGARTGAPLAQAKRGSSAASSCEGSSSRGNSTFAATVVPEQKLSDLIRPKKPLQAPQSQNRGASSSSCDVIDNSGRRTGFPVAEVYRTFRFDAAQSRLYSAEIVQQRTCCVHWHTRSTSNGVTTTQLRSSSGFTQILSSHADLTRHL